MKPDAPAALPAAGRVFIWAVSICGLLAVGHSVFVLVQSTLPPAWMLVGLAVNELTTGAGVVEGQPAASASPRKKSDLETALRITGGLPGSPQCDCLLSHHAQFPDLFRLMPPEKGIAVVSHFPATFFLPQEQKDARVRSHWFYQFWAVLLNCVELEAGQLNGAAGSLLPEENLFGSEPVMRFRCDDHYQGCVKNAVARIARQNQPGGGILALQKD